VQKDNTVIVQALLDGGAKNVGDHLREVIGVGGFADLPVLSIAARNKDTVIIQALTRHGWDVNAMDVSGENALSWAGDAATIKTLIACGAKINVTNNIGETPLDNAVMGNTTDEAEALLAGGAYDADALTWAVAADNMKAVKILVDRGWNLAKVDSLGETPLMTALGAGRGGPLHPAAALLLILHSTNVNYQDKHGMNPLMFASKGNSTPDADEETTAIVKALIEKGR
jgi:ankyrin repeat protein